MVYEWLTGSVPFDGDTQSAILVQHVIQPPPVLPASLSNHQEIQKVLFKALEKDHTKRFPKIMDFAHEEGEC